MQLSGELEDDDIDEHDTEFDGNSKVVVDVVANGMSEVLKLSSVGCGLFDSALDKLDDSFKQLLLLLSSILTV